MEEIYTSLFDDRSILFSTEPGRNTTTLEMYQLFANDKLRTQGHLFLNEVLDMLRLPRTPVGQRFGWVYFHKFQQNGVVDFGVFFAEDHPNAIPLVFNTEGDIMPHVNWGKQ